MESKKYKSFKEVVNEKSNIQTRILKYYKTISVLENIPIIPIKFIRAGKNGAAVVFYKNKPSSPLYIAIDTNVVGDLERAILHEMAHVYFLCKEGYPGHNAKYKKKEKYLIEKYFYSEYSNILFNYK